MIVDNLFMTSFCNLVVMTKGRVGVPSTRFQVGRINPCRSIFSVTIRILYVSNRRKQVDDLSIVIVLWSIRVACSEKL